MPRAVVIGSPIGHSSSPLLHTAGYRALGLDTWSYGRAEVTAPEVGDFVAASDHELRGISVTMPCKEAALACSTTRSSLADEVGAANTLVRTAKGWHADNTDVAGVVQALRGAGYRASTEAVVLGSGATARSVVAALSQLEVQEVTFVVRAAAREETLALAERRGLTVHVVREDVDAAPAVVARGSLVVSTTPAHAADALAERLGREPRMPDAETGKTFFLDVVYADWPTAAAKVMAQRGATIVSGLDMLVHQAAAQFELFTGHDAPIADMLQAAAAAVE